MAATATAQASDPRVHVIAQQFKDWRWRLNNIYWIVDQNGQRVLFNENAVQTQFLDALHDCNLVLKARQPGISTCIQLIMLDAAMFNPNIACGTIAHTRTDAEEIFRTKTKYPYDNLPEGLRNQNKAELDSARHLVFDNNSSIRVGTSLRSGTLQYLHVSEYGKLCAKFPEKAREVKTGALNTVQAGQMVFVESTAEGQEGHFFELCERARIMRDQGIPLTLLDFKLHFFPWFQKPSYRMANPVQFTEAELEYFENLKSAHGIDLDQEQRNWYAAKARQQDEDMLREYPSTEDEAFHAAVEGAYFATQFRKIDAEGRICDLPVLEEARVDTWWDLGLNDAMTIWFVQQDGPWWNVVDFYENSGEGLGHYAEVLSDRRAARGYRYGQHLWPHDGSHRVMDEKGRKRNEIMVGLGYSPQVMNRGDLLDGIEATRDLLSKCRFDKTRTERGVKKLRHYRKEWDDSRSVFKNRPLHDDNSHAADAFRTGAMDMGKTRPDWSQPASRPRRRV